MVDDDDKRFGVRLRGGLPANNGLATRSEELCDETTTTVFAVTSMRVAAVTHNTENDSRTASMKLLAIEADLLPPEVDVIKLIIDRARVRRTGEQPLFDTSDMPENPAVLLHAVPDGSGDKPPRARRSRGGAKAT